MDKSNPSSDSQPDISVRKDRSEGSILGAFIGDAIGCVVEGEDFVSEEDLTLAMQMIG